MINTELPLLLNILFCSVDSIMNSLISYLKSALILMDFEYSTDDLPAAILRFLSIEH